MVIELSQGPAAKEALLEPTLSAWPLFFPEGHRVTAGIICGVATAQKRVDAAVRHSDTRISDIVYVFDIRNDFLLSFGDQALHFPTPGDRFPICHVVSHDGVPLLQSAGLPLERPS